MRTSKVLFLLAASVIVSTSGYGQITGVTAGTGLNGGGTSGNVTLNLTLPVSTANSLAATPTACTTGTVAVGVTATGACVANTVPNVLSNATTCTACGADTTVVLSNAGGIALSNPTTIPAETPSSGSFFVNNLLGLRIMDMYNTQQYGTNPPYGLNGNAWNNAITDWIAHKTEGPPFFFSGPRFNSNGYTNTGNAESVLWSGIYGPTQSAIPIQLNFGPASPAQWANCLANPTTNIAQCFYMASMIVAGPTGTLNEVYFNPGMLSYFGQGSVTYVANTTAGSGQTPGTYTVNASSGSAQIQVVVNSSGTVTAVPAVLNPGSGYSTPPTFALSAGGTPATFTALTSLHANTGLGSGSKLVGCAFSDVPYGINPNENCLNVLNTMFAGYAANGANGFTSYTNYQTANFYLTAYYPGQGGASVSVNANQYSPGDNLVLALRGTCNGELYGSAQGCSPYIGYVGESNTVFTGLVSTVTPNPQSTYCVTNPGTACDGQIALKLQGTGGEAVGARMVLADTSSNVYTTGNIAKLLNYPTITYTNGGSGPNNISVVQAVPSAIALSGWCGTGCGSGTGGIFSGTSTCTGSGCGTGTAKNASATTYITAALPSFDGQLNPATSSCSSTPSLSSCGCPIVDSQAYVAYPATLTLPNTYPSGPMCLQVASSTNMIAGQHVRILSGECVDDTQIIANLNATHIAVAGLYCPHTSGAGNNVVAVGPASDLFISLDDDSWLASETQGTQIDSTKPVIWVDSSGDLYYYVSTPKGSNNPVGYTRALRDVTLDTLPSVPSVAVTGGVITAVTVSSGAGQGSFVYGHPFPPVTVTYHGCSVSPTVQPTAYFVPDTTVVGTSRVATSLVFTPGSGMSGCTSATAALGEEPNPYHLFTGVITQSVNDPAAQSGYPNLYSGYTLVTPNEFAACPTGATYCPNFQLPGSSTHSFTAGHGVIEEHWPSEFYTKDSQLGGDQYGYTPHDKDISTVNIGHDTGHGQDLDGFLINNPINYQDMQLLPAGKQIVGTFAPGAQLNVGLLAAAPAGLKIRGGFSDAINIVAPPASTGTTVNLMGSVLDVHCGNPANADSAGMPCAQYGDVQGNSAFLMNSYSPTNGCYGPGCSPTYFGRYGMIYDIPNNQMRFALNGVDSLVTIEGTSAHSALSNQATLVVTDNGSGSGAVSTNGVITSTIATGTAPFVVASTTPVANLSIGGNAATASTLVGAPGSNTQVFYNNGGALAASSSLTTNGTSNTLIGTTSINPSGTAYTNLGNPTSPLIVNVQYSSFNGAVTFGSSYTSPVVFGSNSTTEYRPYATATSTNPAYGSVSDFHDMSIWNGSTACQPELYATWTPTSATDWTYSIMAPANTSCTGVSPVVDYNLSTFVDGVKVSHLISVADGAAVTIASGAGAGSGGSGLSVTLTAATDLKGTINVTTPTGGTAPAASSVIATITFGKAYQSGPVCQVTPASASAMNLFFSPPASASSFTVNSGPTALAAGTTYKYSYLCEN